MWHQLCLKAWQMSWQISRWWFLASLFSTWQERANFNRGVPVIGVCSFNASLSMQRFQAAPNNCHWCNFLDPTGVNIHGDLKCHVSTASRWSCSWYHGSLCIGIGSSYFPDLWVPWFGRSNLLLNLSESLLGKHLSQVHMYFQLKKSCRVGWQMSAFRCDKWFHSGKRLQCSRDWSLNRLMKICYDAACWCY